MPAHMLAVLAECPNGSMCHCDTQPTRSSATPKAEKGDATGIVKTRRKTAKGRLLHCSNAAKGRERALTAVVGRAAYPNSRSTNWWPSVIWLMTAEYDGLASSFIVQPAYSDRTAL